jgi:hypothetical protein
MPIIAHSDFETLVNAYTNYIFSGNREPPMDTLITIYGTNKEFYAPLKELHDNYPLMIKGIGLMLNRLLEAKSNNRTNKMQDRLAPEYIEKEINSHRKHK